MGIINWFKENFSCSQLKPIHDEPMLFVVSQWQRNKSKPGVLYLIYRIATCSFLLTTWVMSKIYHPHLWCVYLTNWGYTVLTLQAVLASILSCGTVLSHACNAIGIRDCFLRIHPLYWIAHQMALPIGFMITIVFWAVINEDDEFTTVMNIHLHGSNSIYLFVDLLIIGHPIRIFHFVYSFIFGLVYCIFSVIFYFYDIHEEGGTGYVYEIFDWGYPYRTLLVALIIGLTLLVLHILSYCIHKLKVLIYNRLFPQTEQNTEQLEV